MTFVVNRLLTKFAWYHTRRTSVFHFFFPMDLTALGLYCQDLGSIFVQYIPQAWLMSYTYNLATFYIRAELILTNFIFSTLIFLFLGNVIAKKVLLRVPKLVHFTLWDSPDLQRLGRTGLFNHVDCAIIMYDITRQDSLQVARKWLGILRREFRSNFFKVLAGNKADLVSERKVTYEVCFSTGLRQA